MYEKHFGLKKRLFGAKADGTSVFVGPQQNKSVGCIQKGIAAPDAVVTITGPVGVGKTTLVNRALETLPTGRTAAHIGRMHLSQEEVVDLLMGGFGIKKSLSGAIRRFAAFRRILQQQSENSIPVAIVIEDAQRLGTDALAEVEALTAADAGDTASANIILMGQPGLHDLLAKPDLARLKQRVRLRHIVAALTPAEARGYLKHSVREAGGDFDAIFDAGVADIVYQCSDGIPRIINTLCESAMTAAMEENSSRVTAALMSQVAKDAFGYEAHAVDVSSTPAAATAVVSASCTQTKADTDDDIDWEKPPQPQLAEESENVDKDEPHSAAGTTPAKSEIGHDIVVESGYYPVINTIESAAPVEVAQIIESAAAEESTGDTNILPIPELINDTQPELPEISLPLAEPSAPCTQIDEPAKDANSQTADESDIESTQTLAQPVGLVIDEAASNASPLETAEQGNHCGADTAAVKFDLDAAISPQTDDTNVMPAITPNLDKLVSEKNGDTIVQEIIMPEPEPVPEPEPEPEPKPEPEAVAVEIPLDNDLPTLSDSMRVDVEKEVTRAKKIEPVASPPVDTAPNLDATTNAPAMLAPSCGSTDAIRESDIDALEAALAAAKSGELAAPSEIPAIPKVNGAAPELQAEDPPTAVPEITLDKLIANQQEQNDQLDRFREEIGSANSLEDISDLTAETLFGVEFDQIAAAAVANPSAYLDTTESESNPSLIALTDDEVPIAANDADELDLDKKSRVETTPEMPKPGISVPLNESTRLRIETLNAMKSNAKSAAENVEMSHEDPANDTPKTRGPQPEPIECQIDTSITQTLKALDISKMADSEVEPTPEKKSGGLFSRFRKSS